MLSFHLINYNTLTSTINLKKIKLLFLFLFIGLTQTNAQDNIPVLSEIVTDQAQLFSESELIQLKEKLTR